MATQGINIYYLLRMTLLLFKLIITAVHKLTILEVLFSNVTYAGL